MGSTRSSPWRYLFDLQHRRADGGGIHLIHGRESLFEDLELLGQPGNLIE